MRTKARITRYTGVSLVTTLLAQAGLALAIWAWSWPVAPAVLFSGAVSAGPAYWLSRKYVWPDGGKVNATAGEASEFFAVALAGSVTSIVVVWSAIQLARLATHDHVALSVTANAASVTSTGLVWMARYLILDRLLFPRRGTVK
jgi:putative flippase GtrA